MAVTWAATVAVGWEAVRAGSPQGAARDGQLVRVVAVENPDDRSELEELGAAGQAHWLGHEGGWFVTVPGHGTGIHPSEYLDFEPVLSPGEEASLLAYVKKASSWSVPIDELRARRQRVRDRSPCQGCKSRQVRSDRVR